MFVDPGGYDEEVVKYLHLENVNLLKILSTLQNLHNIE